MFPLKLYSRSKQLLSTAGVISIVYHKLYIVYLLLHGLGCVHGMGCQSGCEDVSKMCQKFID